MTSAPFDIFISYPGDSQEDGRYARMLAEELESFGLQTWIAGRDRAHYGNDALREALAAAPVFIACLGARPAGRWGQEEMARAAQRHAEGGNHLLYTVLLPGATGEDISLLPPAFRQAPRFDFRFAVDSISVSDMIPVIWQVLQPDRFELLQRLMSACRSGARAVALAGMAGSGKTVLAQVAMNLLRGEYPGGYAFLTIKPHDSLEDVAHRAVGTLNPEYREMPPGWVPLNVYSGQLSGVKSLLVFDDAERDDLENLVPPAPSTAIFITRRRPKLSAEHMIVEVPPLTRNTRRRGTPVRPLPKAPGYDSDVVGGEDMLEIEGSVNAICAVIAAKSVLPPLSIGLFGEWGAGKTFFVEKMRERISTLAEASRDAERSAFCASVRQIEFNAWHYADVNLWASLASRIFQGLAEQDGATAGEIVAKLPSAQARLVAASKAVDHAEEELGETEAKTEERLKNLTPDRGATLASSIADASIKESLISELAETLPEGKNKATVDVADDLLTTAGTLYTVWSMSKATVLAAAAVLAIGVAVVVFLPSVPVLLASLYATALAEAGVIAKPARWARKASMIARRRTEEARRRQEDERKQKEEELRRELHESEERRDRAKRAMNDLEREIEEVSSGRRLAGFISERSDGAAYETYFGVVSVVRRDFEELARQIERHAEAADGPADIQRIVLYVDDLDRCPPERVVQVLEAVHLLMASELFVVVVAVDPRWLLHSLERHHLTGSMPPDSDAWVPSPEDYLEKIFQIPYGIPRMSDVGFQRLLENLVLVEKSDPASDHGRSRNDKGVISADGDDARVQPDGYGAATIGPPALESGDARPAIDLEPDGLRLHRSELEFMSCLGAILKTPRTAKRLVNIYRLVRISLPPRRLDELTGSESMKAGYPCVLLLLAIVIGAPAISARLLSELRKAPSGSWWSWVDDWTPPAGQEKPWQMLLNGMEPLRLDYRTMTTDELADWVPDATRFSYDASPLLDGSLPTGA